MELLYRSNQLERVRIELSEIREEFVTRSPNAISGTGELIGTATVSWHVAESNQVFRAGIDIRGFAEGYWPNLQKETVIDELARLSKWLVINGRFRDFAVQPNDFPKLTVSRRGTEDVGYEVAPSGVFRIMHPALSELAVRESRLARRAIISELYHRGTLTHEDILAEAHMPRSCVETEINGLRASIYVVRESQANFLTTAGREYYEERLRKRSSVAFIVAACRADKEANKNSDHSRALNTYIETLSGLGFEPVFQENEESWKGIIVDIFDYIDTCEIVIADLTWQRPNCYIEIGYALAREKPILTFIEETYFQEYMSADVPFDLRQITHQTYSYDNLDELKTKLQKRVEIWKRRWQSL